MPPKKCTWIRFCYNEYSVYSEIGVDCTYCFTAFCRRYKNFKLDFLLPHNIDECCNHTPVSQFNDIGSFPDDFLRLKFRVAHTKDDAISILMHKYTNTNMYIIKKIISCRFILCWHLTSLLKPYEKSCRRRKVKIEKILTVTYRTLLTKTTNFLKSGGYKICL